MCGQKRYTVSGLQMLKQNETLRTIVSHQLPYRNPSVVCCLTLELLCCPLFIIISQNRQRVCAFNSSRELLPASSAYFSNNASQFTLRKFLNSFTDCIDQTVVLEHVCSPQCTICNSQKFSFLDWSQTYIILLAHVRVNQTTRNKAFCLSIH